MPNKVGDVVVSLAPVEPMQAGQLEGERHLVSVPHSRADVQGAAL
jgi:hypothetical protein